MAILSIDAGTTGVTALVVNDAGEIVSRGYQEFPQHFPNPGWVEHEPLLQLLGRHLVKVQ